MARLLISEPFPFPARLSPPSPHPRPSGVGGPGFQRPRRPRRRHHGHPFQRDARPRREAAAPGWWGGGGLAGSVAPWPGRSGDAPAQSKAARPQTNTGTKPNGCPAPNPHRRPGPGRGAARGGIGPHARPRRVRGGVVRAAGGARGQPGDGPRHPPQVGGALGGQAGCCRGCAPRAASACRAAATGPAGGRARTGRLWDPYQPPTLNPIPTPTSTPPAHPHFLSPPKRWDYGAILLADERFAAPQNQRQLSKWLRQHLVHHQAFGGAIGSLTKFFKVRGFGRPPVGGD
jgi:hypothetical protein